MKTRVMTIKAARRVVSAAEFKAHCLGILDQVAANRETVIVTKRGKAVAKLTTVDNVDPKPLRGSVRYHGDIVAPLDEEWDALR